MLRLQKSYATVCNHITEAKDLVKPAKIQHMEITETRTLNSTKPQQIEYYPPYVEPKKFLTQLPITNFDHEPSTKTRNQCNHNKSIHHSPIVHHQRHSKKQHGKIRQQGRLDKLNETLVREDNADDIDDAYINSLSYFDSYDSISSESDDRWW